MALHLLAGVLAISQPAVANAATVDQATAHKKLFKENRLMDDTLARMTGTASALLSKGGVSRMTRDEAEAFGQLMASNGRVQMDVWWGSIGSEMVAQAIRAGNQLP